ncbi:MAG: metallophosphoesterase [Pseudoxanthomonas sp.]|nr:MAG: metallophosphoesterase [Pseudoxanthomonas sp.]
MCKDCRKSYNGPERQAASDARLAEKIGGGVFQGNSPKHDLIHPVSDGYLMKGASTLYREDGTVAAQWIKSTVDDVRREAMMREAIAAFGEKIPRERPRPAPARTVADLCNVYVLTDFHLGMLAWGEETGADWDTDIAERMLVDWFAAAIAQAPAAELAVFGQLGDFLHWDGMDAVTPASKHLLDADTRFQKLVRVAIRAIRRVIGMLLAKHQRVHVLMAEGNHDPASSIWLREWLAASFENEPRVTVDTSPDPYYCVEWGSTALFFHHGHKRKPKDIDTVFAAKFREVFGRTQHAYAHMGHLHHIDVKETNLMVVEQHRTLAAPDAYAARGGWMSGRDATVVTYSKQHGEVSRCRISSKMLEAA